MTPVNTKFLGWRDRNEPNGRKFVPIGEMKFLMKFLMKSKKKSKKLDWYFWAWEAERSSMAANYSNP